MVEMALATREGKAGGEGASTCDVDVDAVAPARHGTVTSSWRVRACLAAVLVFGLGAASACSNSARDPEATYSPSPFDKGSTITVVLASGSDLAKPIEARSPQPSSDPTCVAEPVVPTDTTRPPSSSRAPPKVLVVDAMDEDAFRDDLNTAQEAGAVVIALSSLPKDTKAFDSYVGADPQATGKLQGQALVDGVRGRVEKAAPKVELFAGPPTDAAAQMRFDAARDVIGPADDAKTVEVGSRATMVKELSEGKEPTLNHKDDGDNGAEAVPAHLLTPTIVRRGDAATIFAKNETLKALVTP